MKSVHTCKNFKYNLSHSLINLQHETSTISIVQRRNIVWGVLEDVVDVVRPVGVDQGVPILSLRVPTRLLASTLTTYQQQ